MNNVVSRLIDEMKELEKTTDMSIIKSISLQPVSEAAILLKTFNVSKEDAIELKKAMCSLNTRRQLIKRPITRESKRILNFPRYKQAA